jgi:hypothetical protein
MTGETGFEPAQHSFGNCYSTVELLPYENFLKNNGLGVFSEADLFALAALVVWLSTGRRMRRECRRTIPAKIKIHRTPKGATRPTSGIYRPAFCSRVRQYQAKRLNLRFLGVGCCVHCVHRNSFALHLPVSSRALSLLKQIAPVYFPIRPGIGGTSRHDKCTTRQEGRCYFLQRAPVV